jgi:2'-5' RNA ligase
MAAVRTFISINLDASLHKSLSDVLRTLSSSKAGVKWVPPENAHLTLKFLGNVEETRLAEVFAACERAAGGVRQIDLEMRAVGCFPSVDRPRIVWLGVQKGVEELKQLQRKVEEELEQIGYPREDREFRAHLTIGRVKGKQGMSRLRRLLEQEKNIFIGSMRADKISVMKSKILPGGPVYTELKAIPLQ